MGAELESMANAICLINERHKIGKETKFQHIHSHQTDEMKINKSNLVNNNRNIDLKHGPKGFPKIVLRLNNVDKPWINGGNINGFHQIVHIRLKKMIENPSIFCEFPRCNQILGVKILDDTHITCECVHPPEHLEIYRNKD